MSSEQTSDISEGFRMPPGDANLRPGGNTMRPSMSFASSVSLRIYEDLRREILAGALRPGTRLHQANLARTYGVSITPIREALSALTSDGFVDSHPYSRTVVHQPTLKELDEIYEIRAELTPLTVRRVIQRATEEDLQRAEKQAEAMRTGAITVPWPQANRDFHSILESACGNDQLIATVGRLADLSRAYVALSVASSMPRESRANEQHMELIRLFREKDVDAAIAASLHHIEETHMLVRAVFLRGQSRPAEG